MTLHDYFSALRKRWALLLVLTILGAALGYGYGTLQTDTYRAQSSVVIVPARGDTTSELVQGSNYVQGLVATYTVVATSPVVLDRVIASLGLDTTSRDLARIVSVSSPLDTTVLEIAVSGADPGQITRIANAVSNELADAVENLSPQTTSSGPAVRVEQISPASEPRSPIAPNTRLLAVIGALIGLLAAAVIAILRQVLTTRLVSRADIAEVTDIAVLGQIPVNTTGVPLAVAVRDTASGSLAEAVRTVAASLRFANVDGEARVVLVTSPESGDGKSSIALTLAAIAAEQDQRVLLIDADLRRGTVADVTGFEGAVGLTTVLLGDVTLDDATEAWGESGLRVLTSGATPPNPGQLLASGHLRQLLAQVREEFDLVVVDSPPVLAVSDALWLAPAVEGIIVVARSRRTKREALARTLAELEATRTRIMGIVLNDVKRVASSPYYERAEVPPAGRSTWFLRGRRRG